MTVTAEQFREALASWASGVTIVTSRHGETLHGMTVSAFNSVSLDPPLVLVCADKSSDTHAVIARSGCFAVNVLPTGQEDLSTRFAVKKDEHRRFEGVDWEAAETGAPLLREAMTGIDCRVEAAHDAGDHVIYVGRVEAVRGAGGEPLLYYRGRYRSLAPAGEGGS
jgi:flavin reductase (DIM6/NTAB) family NADH-FMN oxidoreductase RutF